MNNVDLIENLFFSRKKKEEPELEERNKIKSHDFCFSNEVQISEQIKRVLPNYSRFFDVLTDYSNIKVSSNPAILEDDINEEEEREIVISTEKHVLVNYKNEYRVDFYSFILNLPTPKLLIFHIIDSYLYLTRSLLVLKENNICFFNITAEKIVYNVTTLKPLLHDFEHSIDTKNLNEEYLCKIVDKIDDFSNMPLEIHVIFYLIKNNENSLSYSIITEICDNFVENMSVLSIFSQKYRDNFKLSCIETLKKYINVHKTEIINHILTFSGTWDNYGLSMLFLEIVGNMTRVFSLTDNFLTKFSILLSKNINPVPSKREELSETFNKYERLFIEYPDWSFITSISDEKMELLMEKLLNF
jgi:hypothetical protein